MAFKQDDNSRLAHSPRWSSRVVSRANHEKLNRMRGRIVENMTKENMKKELQQNSAKEVNEGMAKEILAKELVVD